MAEVFAEAGLPEGVLSIVPGGIETGQALTSNPDIDIFSFTGSSAVGKEIGKRAAEMLKPCTLELGGKSAAILLDDVDLAASVPMLVFSGIMNTGQACVAQTRILAPRSRYDEIVDAVSTFAQALPVGPPSDPGAQIGSLISEKQRARVEGYIAKGVEEGARLVCGGGRPEGLDTGFFVQPTVFADVDNKMTIAQEEIFGPVLSIIPYDTEEDAIKIANDSAYGLAGSVWTTNVPARHRDLREDPHRDIRDQLVRVRSVLSVRRLQELRHRPRERAGGRRALHPAEERADADGLHRRRLARIERHASVTFEHQRHAGVTLGDARGRSEGLFAQLHDREVDVRRDLAFSGQPRQHVLDEKLCRRDLSGIKGTVGRCRVAVERCQRDLRLPK